MVDFSISYIVPTVNEEVLTEDSQLKIDPLVDEIKGLFHHWEQNLLIKQEEEEEKTGKFRKFLMYTTWEIALIVGLMLAQVFAIKKITNDYSII